MSLNSQHPATLRKTNPHHRPELTHLRFGFGPGVTFSFDKSTFSLPFKLNHLCIAYAAPFPLPLLHALFRSATITSLDLRFVLDIQRLSGSFISTIELYGSIVTDLHLRYLRNLEYDLGGGLTDESSAKRVTLFVSKFTRLRSLSISLEDPHYFEQFPNTLVKLAVLASFPVDPRDPTNQFAQRYCLELVSLLEKTSGLKVLEVECDPNNGVARAGYTGMDTWVGFYEIPKVCRRKGIRLRWVGDWRKRASEIFCIPACFLIEWRT